MSGHGSRTTQKDATCPWWLIWSFDNPLRAALHRPERILAGLVREGQIVLDVGPGIGFFTIPLARMVGMRGQVIAADLQPQMLTGLQRRAQRAGVLDRIRLHISRPDAIGVTTPVDFALAFWMVHEVRNPGAFLNEIFRLLRPGGLLLVVEPVIHVTKAQFLKSVQIALEQGFQSDDGPPVVLSRSILLQKPGEREIQR